MIEMGRWPDSRVGGVPNRREGVAAVLYDDLYHYMYLFGGVCNRTASRTIQVYNPTFNSWTVIRAEMHFARSTFTAVKYQREGFFLGGCPQRSIEAFNLNTGQSRLLFVGFQAELLENCGGVIGDTLIGHTRNQSVIFNLTTEKVKLLPDNPTSYSKFRKRMWVVGEMVVFIYRKYVVLGTFTASELA